MAEGTRTEMQFHRQQGDVALALTYMTAEIIGGI